MVRFGLIGIGAQGLDHLEASKYSKKAAIVSVCDTRSEILISVKSKFPGLQVYNCLDEMLLNKRDLQGLVIALPHHVYGQVWPKIESFALPVLKEKPLGRTLAEALGFLSISAAPGVFLKTAIQRRHHPSYRFLANHLKNTQNKVDIYEVHGTLHLGKNTSDGGANDDWRNDSRSAGGGALIDCGYHLLDLVTSISGHMELLSATLWCRGVPAANRVVEDEAKIYAKSGNVWIFMEIWRGGVVVNSIPQKREEIVLSTSKGEFKANRTGVWLDDVQMMECGNSWTEALADQLDCFADDIIAKRFDDSEVWEQAPIMRVIERAYALSRESRPFKETIE